MTFITADRSREGLPDFPAGFTPIARDDLGDTLAVDGEGAVWSFEHGAGDWENRALAFSSVEDMERHVAFQSTLEIPGEEESLDALRERKLQLKTFGKSMRSSPYAREAVQRVLADLTEEIADRRFRQSKRGQSIAARQELGQLCEQALGRAGVPGEWMVRPHMEKKKALVAVGPASSEWSEVRLRELLQPVVGTDFELLFFINP